MHFNVPSRRLKLQKFPWLLIHTYAPVVNFNFWVQYEINNNNTMEQLQEYTDKSYVSVGSLSERVKVNINVFEYG
jgi:hypothetical protein